MAKVNGKLLYKEEELFVDTVAKAFSNPAKKLIKARNSRPSYEDYYNDNIFNDYATLTGLGVTGTLLYNALNKDDSKKLINIIMEEN